MFVINRVVIENKYFLRTRERANIINERPIYITLYYAYDTFEFIIHFQQAELQGFENFVAVGRRSHEKVAHFMYQTRFGSYWPLCFVGIVLAKHFKRTYVDFGFDKLFFFSRRSKKCKYLFRCFHLTYHKTCSDSQRILHFSGESVRSESSRSLGDIDPGGVAAAALGGMGGGLRPIPEEVAAEAMDS